jgi:hypothetical protein
MLNHLKELNKNIAFYDIFSEEFSEYGRVIDDIGVSEIMAEAKAIPYPESGSAYLPSVKSFEATDAAKKVKEAIFGALDTQMGYCYGHNDRLNATEWHFSSELNIALTPLVLILGKRSDIKEWRIDSTKMKAFYVPKGAVIEVYATTLHFCPCQESDSGFGCVVGLPLGTNTPLDAPVEDKLLFRKNKWLLAHEDNEVLIGRGAAAGICGENYTVRY